MISAIFLYVFFVALEFLRIYVFIWVANALGCSDIKMNSNFFVIAILASFSLVDLRTEPIMDCELVNPTHCIAKKIIGD